jgi:hypothetical protein
MLVVWDSTPRVPTVGHLGERSRGEVRWYVWLLWDVKAVGEAIAASLAAWIYNPEKRNPDCEVVNSGTCSCQSCCS